MSEINANTPVTDSSTEDGKIVVSGGEGDLWDDLERVTAKPAKKADDSKKVEAKSKDLTSDDQKGAAKAKVDEKKPVKDAKDPKEADIDDATKEEKKEIERQVKKIKAKIGDIDSEIDEDASFDVKINGKIERVSLRDALNQYSGTTDLNRKYSQLNTDKQKFSKAQSMANERLKDIFEEQDSEMKLFKLADLAGKDPIEFYRGWHESGIKMLENYYDMSEDQRANALLQAENKFHKSRADKIELTRKQDIERGELEKQVSMVKQQAKVTDAEYQEAYEVLKDIYKDPEVVKSFGLSEKLSPETVIVAINKDKILKAASDKIDELGIKWSRDERNAKLIKLTDSAVIAGFTPAEIPQLVEQVFGGESVNSRVRNKQEDRKTFISGQKPAVNKPAQTKEAIFFDDL